ncbi:MAG: glycoside hydrolase family 3 N-terminal domain-containing protein [Spirochaetales bacterium]|nr:glycoside hydrolase family 3 N-terminal domain-containing protein [Spirochaetales bacterium]
MFDRLIRKLVAGVMNSENDSSFAMAGKVLDQSSTVPELTGEGAEEQIEALIREMSLEEKIAMIGGKENLGIRGIPRLNIPDVWCTDASAGVRCFGRSTAFPVPVAMAATWSRELQRKTGEAIGEECRAKGVSVLLGPGVNIYRVPTNGRNFEYMGEDPYLAAEMAVPYIKGVQSRGVITTVKHLACNNSDYDRHRMNSEVDERTLHEIYLPAFKAAVQKGGSKSVMCAYNPVNGVYASENRELLTEILREQWGFKGFVISDWTCVYSTEGPLKAGLDLEMPYGKYMNLKKILPLIKDRTVSEEMIDTRVRNMMRAFIEIGAYSRKLKDENLAEYSAEHSQISLEGAREAVVLLKNEENILPLKPEAVKKIALLGFNASGTTTCGGGSCCVRSYDKVSIEAGIREQLPESAEIRLMAQKKKPIRLSKEEKRFIREADAVIVAAGFSTAEESESFDRSWELPFHQDALIRECTDLNPSTIVLLTAGGGVETESWIGGVKALVHTFYLGERAGQAVAEILFGRVNPSGKLPFTMARCLDDFESAKHYVENPGKISPLRILGPQGTTALRKPWTLKYGEKLMVGYRHFDTNGVEPRFPFGHGLSYTEFAITGAELSSETMAGGGECRVTVDVENRGSREGSEVVQLYIRDDKSALPRPEKELKGFEKVRLKPGESGRVSFTLTEEHLQYYNPEKGGWISEAGDFTLLNGNSSRNILQRLKLTLRD